MAKRLIVAYKDNKSHTTLVDETNLNKLKKKTLRAISSYKLNGYTKITINGIVKYEKS